VADRLRAYLGAYLVLCRMWAKAAWQYPASLVMLSLGHVVVTGLEFGAVLVVFAHTTELAGFSLPEMAFLYGTTGVSFAVVEAAIGVVDNLGQRIRTGTFDVMLVRPVPALVQLAAEGFNPRRLAAVLQAAAVLGYGLATVDTRWTAGRVAMVPVMLLAGMGIFAAVFVLGAAFQFLANDAVELQAAFTHGGRFLTQYPISLYGREAARALTFVLPMAFINWQPALYVLDRADPTGLPSFLRFCSPLVAALLLGLAGLAWRAGLRGYRSTGS
jgi:viologen exporter family transport system permease protein